MRFKDPIEALQVYRDKDIVEKCFDDLKNGLDMKRLRMHTIETVDGRLFVQFIALLFISALRKEMRESRLIESYTIREFLFEMDPPTKIRYAGKYGQRLTEVTKTQREILELLKIDLPVSAWLQNAGNSGNIGRYRPILFQKLPPLAFNETL
ncbi:MAG: hypothetical protein ABFC84_03625 [Veillonellales bacterium]